MGRDREQIEFRPDDPGTRGAVLARMDRLRRDRNGWINLLPGVDPEYAPPPPLGPLGSFFGTPPADVPMCTWSPSRRRRPSGHVQVGILHAGGRFAATKLRSLGVALPAGAKVNQDHPKRGLILHVPDDTDDDDVLRFMVEAAGALSHIELTGSWRADVFTTGPPR